MAEAETKAPAPISAQLDELFAPWNRADAPGFSVGAVRGGQLLYRRGFGMASLEHATAITPATRMRIGSISKHFTALLALLLAEEGRFDLDVPIRTYLPELTGPAGDPSTRLLLQHRGGGRCYLDLSMTFRGMTLTPAGTALADLTRQSGRNFAPGEAMIYNNGGYHLASIALERAGGAPFEAQLKARLFDPLGMADTASVPSDHIILPGMATMHMPSPGGGWRRGLFPSEEVRGEGAIVSTLDDMLTWCAHLRSRDRFGSADSWRQLTERPTYADGSIGPYALGLLVDTYRGLPIVHHSGGVMGGTAQMLTFPDHGLDIVILANGAPEADVVRLAFKAADLILAEAMGEDVQTIAPAQYEGLIGKWRSTTSGMVYALAEERGVLALRYCGAPMGAPLERTADGRVIVRAGGIGEVEVGLDEAARTGELGVRFGGRVETCCKLEPEAIDRETFAAAARGRYESADAGCVAIIEGDAGSLVIRFVGERGGVETDLAPQDETTALMRARPTGAFPAALAFRRAGETMAGFELNTSRTRGLVFERI